MILNKIMSTFKLVVVGVILILFGLLFQQKIANSRFNNESFKQNASFSNWNKVAKPRWK